MTLTPEIYSIILALATAAAAGLVGSFALMKRMTLAGDVVSHIALPGIGIALLLSVQPFWGAAVALFLGSILIWQLERRSNFSSETAVGVVFVGALALGTLLTPSEELINALFGGFGGLTPALFIVGMISVAIIALFMFYFKDRLILGLFSPDLARTSNVKIDMLNLGYLLVFALTILLGLRFLGSVLVGALIIVPSAIGRQLTHTLGGFLIASSFVAVIATGIGFIVSDFYHILLGPTIVGVATAMFLLSLLKKKD